MSVVKSAIKRMRQRSKLPPGGKIVTRHCSTCNSPMLYWSGDAAVWMAKVRCSQCIETDRNFFRALRAKPT